MLNEKNLITQLNSFHKKLGIKQINKTSPLAGQQFPGEYNVSGFHNEVNKLPLRPGSFWGIDKILRIQDIPDTVHTQIFHMGIFATAIDLKKDFCDPFTDQRFKDFQIQIIDQVFQLLKNLKLDTSKLTATYLAGALIGASKLGKDAILNKKYFFKEDRTSKQLLNKYKIPTFAVPSILNIDLRQQDGALVGPRIELAYQNYEIATLVFDCFKVNSGKLLPINYTGGYAIGIERLMMALNNHTNIYTATTRHQQIITKLIKRISYLKAPLLQDELYSLLSGLEVIANLKTITPKLTDSQKKFLNKLQKDLNLHIKNLNLTVANVNKILAYYGKKL